jgi:hypothetical protein
MVFASRSNPLHDDAMGLGFGVLVFQPFQTMRDSH